MEKSLEKGRVEGMHQSLTEIAIRGLVVKFKKVPTDIISGIEELSIPALKEIILQMIREDGFKSLDEVREYL